MVIPKDIKDIDTVGFCNLLKITKEEFIRKIEKAKVDKPLLPSKETLEYDKNNPKPKSEIKPVVK